MPPRRSSAGPGAGFVLVAVVMFVLALSFLLVYFYALSSYESQFLQRSTDGEQAFQSAVGGVDRVRFLLCATGATPQDVSAAAWAGIDSNVVAALAYQPPDSSAAIDWADSAAVVIRVTASVNGERRTVEGRFRPGDAPSYYRQLLTVSGGVTLDPGAAYERNHTVALYGQVWQGPGAPTSWTAFLAAQPTFAPAGGVPTPDLAGYFANHPANSTVQSTAGGVRLRSNDPWPAYFPGSPPITSATTVQVRGLAVWLFPDSAYFEQRLFVTGEQGQGEADACLVIAAGQGGIRVEDGLSSNIPLILVSSGTVSLRQMTDNNTTNVADELAVYARDVSLTGPRTNLAQLQLHHPVGRLDSLYVGQLSAWSALPNGSSAPHTLTLVPGSWHVSNP